MLPKGISNSLPRLILILFLFCCWACSSSVPFKKIDLVSVNKVNPESVRELFKKSLPLKFKVVNSIVFKYKHQSFSSIGYTTVDLNKKTFKVAGINPMGFKLFELTGDNQNVDCVFAVKEFSRHGDFANAVGDDIRKIYFNRVPSSEAKVCKNKNKIIFIQPSKAGTLEYVFGGAEKVLTEKRFYNQKRLIWSVYYFEYKKENNMLYPAGIILKHHKYSYQLVVRLMEIRS